jgi:hypothetical protein
MKRIHPKIITESWEEQNASGRYYPAEVMEIGHYQYRLNSGRTDDISIWGDKDRYLVLTINNRLGYIGLDEYLKNNREPIDGIFIQDYNEAVEILGKNWDKKSWSYLMRVLINYLS